MRPAFRFKSTREDGGKFTGRLNGKAIEHVFGCFTKNFGVRFEITLNDKGGIQTWDLP